MKNYEKELEEKGYNVTAMKQALNEQIKEDRDNWGTCCSTCDQWGCATKGCGLWCLRDKHLYRKAEHL